MLIDITTQAAGYDCRVQPIEAVRLPPTVREVRYNTRGSTRIDTVAGTREAMAVTLRAHGYTVEYEDGNPWRVIGSKSTPAKRAAARVNGSKSEGRPRSPALLTPPAVVVELARLSKGELMDCLSEAAGRDAASIRAAVQAGLQHRAQRAAKAAQTPSK
jgi:hypothetical protein